MVHWIENISDFLKNFVAFKLVVSDSFEIDFYANFSFEPNSGIYMNLRSCSVLFNTLSNINEGK